MSLLCVLHTLIYCNPENQHSCLILYVFKKPIWGVGGGVVCEDYVYRVDIGHDGRLCYVPNVSLHATSSQVPSFIQNSFLTCGKKTKSLCNKNK